MTTAQRWTMVATSLASSVVFLDGLVVAVALPGIGRDLSTAVIGVLEGQMYVAAGYFAMLAAFLILGGAASDHYGRRRVFTLGLVGFGVTSVLCGLAPTLELLVIGRLVQGASGALLVPGSLAIITATFDGTERARAFGIWAAATSAANILGPLVGGTLIAISWRTAFLMNVPLLLIALWATRRHVAESRDDGAPRRFDWPGAFVGAIAVGGLAFGLIHGQQQAWGDPIAFVALAIGAAAAAAFPILMARRPDPLVPLGLFRSRGFATINLSTFLIYGALYSIMGFQSIYLQGTLGYSPLAAGLVTIPLGVLLVLLSTRVGALAGRIGPRRFLVAGPLLMALGTAWFARIPATSPSWDAQLSDPASLLPPAETLVDILPYVLLFGVGLSLVVAPLTTTLMGSVPIQRAGLGSAINNAISRVGQPLLGALLFVAITGVFYASIGDVLPRVDTSSPGFRAAVAPLNEPPPTTPPAVATAIDVASTEAFRIALIVAAGLLVAGAIVNGVGLRPPEAVRGARRPAATGQIET